MPTRKTLPHDVPVWVDPALETYFITVCCKKRGSNQLATATIAPLLIETIVHRNRIGTWFAHLALVMPDHVHLLINFPPSVPSIRRVVSSWKDWTAKKGEIFWQRDFFEHRIRQEESYREKADYILANPVRAGLVDRAEDWPHVFIADG